MKTLQSKIVCCLLYSVLVSHEAMAATINASSCQQSAVSAAIGQAQVGDIVAVPAGNCSWSGLSISKSIHLKGAGIDQSNITISENSVTKQAAGVTRISGFTFIRNGGGDSARGFRVGGSWRSAEPVIFQDNKFNVSGGGLFRVGVAGGLIIARNQFTGGWDDSLLQLKDDQDSGNSWGMADTMGIRDTNGTLNHYVEGNTFDGGTNQGIDADDSSRVVYRYNVLTFSSFNSHGFDTSPIGVRHFEVYNNQFRHTGGSSQLANQNWSVWIRGGTGVIFNNNFDDIAGSFWGNKPEIKLSNRGAEDARPQGSCGNVSYPVPHQLGQNHNGSSSFTDPIYIWGNTGTVSVGAGWEWGNPCGFNFSTFFQWGRDGINTGAAKPGIQHIHTLIR